MPDLPTDPDALVRQFCDAWADSKPDELAEYFADDAVYHNVPMDPVEGKETIQQVLAGFFAAPGMSIRFETHNQVASGAMVMNERTDHITTDGRTVALPVCGVFEIEACRPRAILVQPSPHDESESAWEAALAQRGYVRFGAAGDERLYVSVTEVDLLAVLKTK